MPIDEIILSYLQNQVRGEGHVFRKPRIARDLQLKEEVVEEELRLLANDGYLKSVWVFIDATDEEFEIPSDDALQAKKTGVFYHPNTLDEISSRWLYEEFLATSKLAAKSSFRSQGWYNEDVYVIRADKIDRVKDFLAHFGLEFVKEKHGNGPEHYACEKDGKVLEIYPARS